MSKNCRRRYQDTAEEGYQEEARKRKVGRTEKNAKTTNKGRRKVILLMKELEALRGWLWKGETRVARRLRMKKRRKLAGRRPNDRAIGRGATFGRHNFKKKNGRKLLEVGCHTKSP